MPELCVIVGAGQAGLSAAQHLREQDYAGRIVLIGDEPHAPYQRPPLSKKILTGEMTTDRLALKPAIFFEANRIEHLAGVRVDAIDAKAARLAFNATSLPFDRLILATGTAARHLTYQAWVKRGVYTLRGIDDVARLKDEIGPGKRLLIIGAGYVGLEVAASAKALGAEVSVIEAAERVLARSVGHEVSRYFETLHRDKGIALHTGVGLIGLDDEGDQLIARLNDGRRLIADAVLVGIGSRPLTALAEEAGLEVDDGIVVDAQCRTSQPQIYAAGDCTRFFSTRFQRSLRLESVQNAFDQGHVAAANIAGHFRAHDPVPWFWSDQYETKLQIAGLSAGHDRAILRGEPQAHRFSVFYFAGRTLLCVDSINSGRDHMLARRLIGQQIAAAPEMIADPTIEKWNTLFEA